MCNIYAKAYTEVLELISYLSEEELNKIPKEKIEYYKKYKDETYVFKIDPNIDLIEQNISQEANAILITIFRDYFATDKQNEVLEDLLKQNEQKYEIQKVSFDDKKAFGNSTEIVNDNEVNEINKKGEEVALIEIKEDKWYMKIIIYIKNILKRG